MERVEFDGSSRGRLLSTFGSYASIRKCLRQGRRFEGESVAIGGHIVHQWRGWFPQRFGSGELEAAAGDGGVRGGVKRRPMHSHPFPGSNRVASWVIDQLRDLGVDR